MHQVQVGGRGRVEAIDVSPEMLTLVGRGRVGTHRWPSSSVAFEIDFGGTRTPGSFRFHEAPTSDSLNEAAHTARLIFIVTREACERLLGTELALEDGAVRCLPADLRTIALAIRDCAYPPAAATPYRLAKSIELLCEMLAAHAAGTLTEVLTPADLSLLDTQRVAAARQLIDQQWQEKLTISQIARRCGLNRSKLTRGFRELYQCTVSEALAERRLAEARRQLLATDLPVGLIGYRSGYQNNASFTRAFGRRFGISPSDYRACQLAA